MNKDQYWDRLQGELNRRMCTLCGKCPAESDDYCQGCWDAIDLEETAELSQMALGVI